MASWVEQLDAKIEAAKVQPLRHFGSHHEEGQTCPRCGDLYSWRALWCMTCKVPLR